MKCLGTYTLDEKSKIKTFIDVDEKVIVLKSNNVQFKMSLKSDEIHFDKIDYNDGCSVEEMDKTIQFLAKNKNEFKNILNRVDKENLVKFMEHSIVEVGDGKRCPHEDEEYRKIRKKHSEEFQKLIEKAEEANLKKQMRNKELKELNKLKRIESEDKVQFNMEKYDVSLKNSNFDTAFETLNYYFGKFNKNEQCIIHLNPKRYCYNNVFNPEGEKRIYFYEDENMMDNSTEEFMNEILEKYPNSMAHVFICTPTECETSWRKQFKSRSNVYEIVDSTLDKASTRIIIGV